MIVTPNEYWEDRTKGNGAQPVEIKLAMVEAVTPEGKPIIRFVGESVASQKKYVHLKSYTPEVGDMVMLINNVIQGGWQSVK